MLCCLRSKPNSGAALLNIAAYKEISTTQLIAAARALPGGTKVHCPDRLTAIVLLLGTRTVASANDGRSAGTRIRTSATGMVLNFSELRLMFWFFMSPILIVSWCFYHPA